MKQLIIFLIIVITIITGCRYKDGPMVSFRSVKKRILTEWKIIELTSGGIDSLQYFIDSCGNEMKIYEMSFDATDFKISFYNGKIKFRGSLTFSDNKKVMNVYFGSYLPDILPFKVIGPFVSDIVSYWKILKLTKNELKVSVDFNNRNYKISFKKL